MDEIMRQHPAWIIGAILILFVIGAALIGSGFRHSNRKRRHRAPRTRYDLLDINEAAATIERRAKQMRQHDADSPHTLKMMMGEVQFDDRVLAYFEGYPPLPGETSTAYTERVAPLLWPKPITFVETVPVNPRSERLRAMMDRINAEAKDGFGRVDQPKR
jgi:hypothetical protein